MCFAALEDQKVRFFSASMHLDSQVVKYTLQRAGLLWAWKEDGAQQLKGQWGRTQ